jgi:hypothetical protein
MTTFPRAALLALLSGAGCAWAWEDRELDDEGQICLNAASASAVEKVDLAVGVPLSVQVNAPACLSSACSRNAQVSCAVELRGRELLLSSRFRWEEATKGSCTDDCNSLSASCETPPLAAGVYTLKHGAVAYTLTLPSSLPKSCLTEL